MWAAELIAGSPDVAVTFTNLALEVMKPIAGRVPIVFIGVGDPVGSGFVSSFAQPGGNITGFASHDPSMGGKWLEVLKETAPNISRVLVIMVPGVTVLQAMSFGRGSRNTTGCRDHGGRGSQCHRDRTRHQIFRAKTEWWAGCTSVRGLCF